MITVKENGFDETRLFVLHFALMPLGKICIHFFTPSYLNDISKIVGHIGISSFVRETHVEE